MKTQALFVDLPNFCSRLLNSDIADPRLLRDYFLYWLDFDRLAECLTGKPSTVWVFYSGRRFGPSENRIENDYLDKYIERINRLKGITARDVNIPGEQREPISYTCQKCGHKGIGQWESEKGIDTSLTVHLFDTMDTWDEAYLLSGDADFVPVVASLRRRGKIVIGAGFPGVSSALVRECYDYVNLREAFLNEDVAAYMVFRTNGIAQKWLTDEVNITSTFVHTEKNHQAEFRVGFEEHSSFFFADNNNHDIDSSGRYEELRKLSDLILSMQSYDDNGKHIIKFYIHPSVAKGIERRFKEFGLSIPQSYQNYNTYYMLYNYNTTSNKFEIFR